MHVDDFHALTVGPVTQGDGSTANLTVLDRGALKVASGRLASCDPFVSLEGPLVTPVPPGTYPVRVTVADVSDEQDGSHLREAYLTVVLAEGTDRGRARHAGGTPSPATSELQAKRSWLGRLLGR